ncbi:DUF6417 family protein [Streptomyces sp. NPDC051016]|uniref:DUF6417 family protein n=1 Tax=Streptomyces sp. NPDC051016 TaxID=3365638 RepID=UPI0037A9C863
MRAERTLEALRVVQGFEQEAEHGWALDVILAPLSQRIRGLRDQNLVEIANRETRAELSAWEGRPVRWAARLSGAGHDVLAFARLLPDPAPPAPAPAAQMVELLPSQMTAVRMYCALVRADQAKVPSAQGLAELVRDAVYDRAAGRWRLHLTTAQLESVAYALWLRQVTGSAGEARRFTRDYGIEPVAPRNGEASPHRS